MEPNEFTRFLEQLTPLQIGVIALALVFLVVGLRLVLRKPPTHLTAFTGEAGNVLVSRKALQVLIKQACLLDDWVEAARPVVRVRGRKVSSRVEVRLSSPENLKDVCERLQGRVTALLQKSLSFDQIGEIQIIVKGFSASDEAKEDTVPAMAPPVYSPPAVKESSLTPRRPSQAPAASTPPPPPAATSETPAAAEPPPELESDAKLERDPQQPEAPKQPRDDS